MEDSRVEEKTALKKAHDDIFNHFQERLLERYGFEINRDEYNELCCSPFIQFRICQKTENKIGVVGFNLKLILVVKAKRGKYVLLTALPPDGIYQTLLVKTNSYGKQKKPIKIDLSNLFK